MTNTFHPVHQCNDGLINTSSGIVVDLKNPTTGMIEIKDIANGLSKICRFGGQLNRYYSVAQHSVLVCHLMREGEGTYILEALMHDASEAYLGDVVKPLKVILGSSYKWLESRFENVIAKKYNLGQSPDIEKLVHKYDMQAVELEQEAFQKGNMLPLMATMDRLGLDYGHYHWEHAQARRFFVACFRMALDARNGKETNNLISYLNMGDLMDGEVG